MLDADRGLTPELAFDPASARRVHVVGVGGAGMSAIATVLAQMGHSVSGSDLRESHVLARLRVLGVDARVGHHPEHVPAATTAVVVSTAISPSNPEVLEALGRDIPVYRRAEALRAIVASRPTIAVAGSHGKTTTSSMLTLMLRAAGWQPSFVIGGDLNEVGTNAHWDEGDWLVVEADESDGTFLELAPKAVVVTSVLPDHLDHYGSFDALVAAFDCFVDDAPGVRVFGIDDPGAAALAVRASERASFGRDDRQATGRVVTYGESEAADYRIRDYLGSRTGSRFTLEQCGEPLGVVELAAPGRHNAANAAGAAAVALELGVPFAAVVEALGSFGGVARRFQFRGVREGVTYVDDYAHLPSDVRAMVGAAREGGWRRVVAVFQPHRYTRTAALWRDFADAFTGVDALVLTDVYPAGETPRPGVSGRLVLHAVLDAHPELPVTYLPRRHDIVAHVPRMAGDGDLVLTLGAGDLTTAPDEWLAVES